MYPQFQLPNQFIFTLTRAILIGQKRSFHLDSSMALSGVHPPLSILGEDNIPNSGPCLILMNHYSRSGYIPIWSAFAISSTLPMESRWMMTYAWTSPNKTWDWFKRRITKIIFTAICRVYGFVPMPPMPPTPKEVMERALAVKTLMGVARKKNPVAIGMAPEGMDFPEAVLGWPPEGMGRLLNELSKIIKNVIPVGVFEEDGKQIISFGKPLTFKADNYSSKDLEDCEVARQVMNALAQLLPERMRGEFKK